MGEALLWLGGDPEGAAESVRLWPALFKAKNHEDDVEACDVQALLKLCEEYSIEPPAIDKIAARGLSDEILGIFAASKIPEARLTVVQALSERHCKLEDLPAVLTTLCEDSCDIVKVAARNLRTGLTKDGGVAQALPT